jgi:8-oxo-dGTP diphosphatase|tara:strand:- start:400 stop:1386 length:987 start_codon:yes stop_codon:yes gene_type:complete
MRKPKVLITGFEPFDKSSFNISEKLVSEIEKLEIKDVELKTKILTVDEQGSKFVSELILLEDFDFILHMGFSRKAQKIHIESRAVNKINMNIKDNYGRVIKNGKVVNEDINEYISTFDFVKIPFGENEIFLISSDAGTFVCNETYFRTLKTIYENKIEDRFNRLLPCLFVHLPSEEFLTILEQVELILSIIRLVSGKKIIEVVAAIITNENGEILVAKRDSNQPHPGKWEFPGGKLEKNEKEIDGLKRELFEEMNINIDISSYCGEVQHLYDEYFVILKAMYAKINKNSPPLELVVHDEFLWVKLENLNSLDWLEANLKLVELIQNQS